MLPEFWAHGRATWIPTSPQRPMGTPSTKNSLTTVTGWWHCRSLTCAQSRRCGNLVGRSFLPTAAASAQQAVCSILWYIGSSGTIGQVV